MKVFVDLDALRALLSPTELETLFDPDVYDTLFGPDVYDLRVLPVHSHEEDERPRRERRTRACIGTMISPSA